MAANPKVVKRRIKSIGNTMKITKAMELVAASKMRRAVESVLATRPYATIAWEMIDAIAKATGDVTHPLIEQNEQAERQLVILFIADRGLAGGYNVNILKETLRTIREDDVPYDAIVVGKRGIAPLEREKVPVIATFENLSNKAEFKDILPMAKMALDAFQEGKYKTVKIAYTDFISGLTQKPRIFDLLPLGQPEEGLGEVKGSEEEVSKEKTNEYTFEPSPVEVLDRVLDRLVETMIYQALLESTASEHAARMMAMRNATDSAKDMLAELKFAYNRLRQASITQEIAEISSGKAALE